MTQDAGVATTTRPLRRDAELNRQRILAAASTVFGERGLEATLDDIAHQAGLGVGTVYRRFPSKEHLVEAMFVERFDKFAELAEKSLSEPDPWQAFVRCLEQMAELHASDRGLREVLLSNAYGRNQVAQAKARMIPVFIRVFERAQASGQLRADMKSTDVPLLQLMLGSVAEYSHTVSPDLWRRYFSLLLDGLRAQPGACSDLRQPALAEKALENVMATWRCPRN